MFTLHMVGLIYFNTCNDDVKRILVPNGMSCGMGHPPHFTSIWVDANRYDSDDWWTDAKQAHVLKVKESNGTIKQIFVLEFRLPEPAELSFSVAGDAVEVINLDNGLPRLQDMHFVVDDEEPHIIAEATIPAGRLEAHKFKGTGSVQWKVSKHEDPMVIGAKVGKRTRQIKLRKYEDLIKEPTPALKDLGMEVVICNAPNFIVPHEYEDGSSGSHTGHKTGHFTLYGKLDKDRNSHNLTKPDLSMIGKLKPLLFDHGFLRFLVNKPNIPDAQCTPTCC